MTDPENLLIPFPHRVFRDDVRTVTPRRTVPAGVEHTRFADQDSLFVRELRRAEAVTK